MICEYPKHLLSVGAQVHEYTPSAFGAVCVLGSIELGSISDRRSILVHNAAVIVHNKFHAKQFKRNGLLAVEAVESVEHFAIINYYSTAGMIAC